MNIASQDAYITVRTTSGHTVKGYVSEEDAIDGFLCLTDKPASDDIQRRFTYVRITSIEAWEHDCR